LVTFQDDLSSDNIGHWSLNVNVFRVYLKLHIFLFYRYFLKRKPERKTRKKKERLYNKVILSTYESQNKLIFFSLLLKQFVFVQVAAVHHVDGAAGGQPGPGGPGPLLPPEARLTAVHTQAHFQAGDDWNHCGQVSGPGSLLPPEASLTAVHTQAHF
jgi:hypothetical protein